MEYRQLGNSGVRVSVIGLGTNRFGSKVSGEEVTNIIDAAVDLGINFIDTADVYTEGRSEETLGRALKGRWNRFVVATKFESPTGDGPNDHGASRYHLMNALDASLRRLQSDHIDLYYVHWPDETTPIEETLRALDDVVRAGKVRYVGASNFAGWQLAEANALAHARGWTWFVVAENHYHMLERSVERDVLPYCRARKAGFVPYFPLAGGFLTGKYQRGRPAPAGSRGESGNYVPQYMTDANYDRVERLSAWAQAHGHALNELAEAWLLAQPAVVSVIAGATRREHVLANVKGGDWVLSPAEVKEIEALLEQQPAIERV
jgi:aryl-alcohol dehydrogenase-like predicted oxidoreductase